MVHQFSHQRRGHLLHHLVEQYGWHHGQGERVFAVSNVVSHLFVRQADHVLTVHLQNLVVGEQAVSSRRTVFHNAGDLAVVENESCLTAVVCKRKKEKKALDDWSKVMINLFNPQYISLYDPRYDPQYNQIKPFSFPNRIKKKCLTFVQSHGPFKWSIANGQRYAVARQFLDEVVQLFMTHAGHKSVVYLQQLIAESEAGQSGR